MRANYLLIPALLMLIACNGNEPSSKDNTTPTNFTIAPAGEKHFQEMQSTLNTTPEKVEVAEVKASPSSTATSYKKLLQQMIPAAETFSVSPYTDTTIISNIGTIIKVDGSSFVTADWGRPVTGPVEINVREFYDLSDMIVAGLSTTSGKQLLETGGMIYISAYANGVECKLKENKKLKIGFPTAEKKEGMKMFTGSVNRKGQFDWTLDQKTQEKVAYMYSKPQFKGGDSVLVNYLETSFNHQDRSRLRTQFSRVFVSFIIDDKGNVVETKILNGISPSVDNEVVRMICDMPQWIPACENGIFVSSRVELPVYFGLDPKRERTPYRVFECNYQAPDFLAETKMVARQYYYLQSSGLGWLNCDRFLAPSNNRVMVASNNGVGMSMQLVFHRMQAIVSGIEKDGRIYFSGLPKGEKVTLIAFGYVNDKPYMFIKETTTDVISHQIVFTKPLSKDAIKNEMAKIENGLMAWNGE